MLLTIFLYGFPWIRDCGLNLTHSDLCGNCCIPTSCISKSNSENAQTAAKNHRDFILSEYMRIYPISHLQRSLTCRSEIGFIYPRWKKLKNYIRYLWICRWFDQEHRSQYIRRCLCVCVCVFVDCHDVSYCCLYLLFVHWFSADPRTSASLQPLSRSFMVSPSPLPARLDKPALLFRLRQLGNTSSRFRENFASSFQFHSAGTSKMI